MLTKSLDFISELLSEASSFFQKQVDFTEIWDYENKNKRPILF